MRELKLAFYCDGRFSHSVGAPLSGGERVKRSAEGLGTLGRSDVEPLNG